MAEENPLKTLVPDGGMTAIFRTMGFIGDSLSSGETEILNEDGSRTYLDYYEYSWGQFIARKCGLTAINMSRGGLTAKSFLQYAHMTNCLQADKACEAYVIALGANDMCNPQTYADGFGFDEEADLSKDTFVSAYLQIIDNVRKCSPDSYIFVMTMPKYAADEKREWHEKHADFLRRLPEKYKRLYVLDFRKYAPVYDAEFQRLYYFNGHMSVMGYKHTADMVATYIDRIIMSKPEDFRSSSLVNKRLGL